MKNVANNEIHNLCVDSLLFTMRVLAGWRSVSALLWCGLFSCTWQLLIHFSFNSVLYPTADQWKDYIISTVVYWYDIYV